jgi:transposase InsO family protein
MRFTFIAAHVPEFHVTTMCRVLLVSKAGYYAWVKRPPSAHTTADEQLAADIRVVHETSRGTYGSPRVQEELKAQGQRHGRKRIARIMRRQGIRAKTVRRFRRTTDSNHAHPIAPNTLARQFAVAQVAAPNRVWVGDITYLSTRAGWLYLAVVLDLGSRRVIGWAMRHTLEGALTADALTMALAGRQPGPGVLHHTDRGSQYAATDYRALLTAHGMACSMSRVGDCWDNAVAESFFATLKRELADDADWHTRDDARTAVFEYIEVWYNRYRRHSSLGYLSPVAYELQHAKKLEFKKAA